jgi:hypothetical protein
MRRTSWQSSVFCSWRSGFPWCKRLSVVCRLIASTGSDKCHCNTTLVVCYLSGQQQKCPQTQAAPSINLHHYFPSHIRVVSFTATEFNIICTRNLVRRLRKYIQKFPLRNNTKGYGGKTHKSDSQNSDTTVPSGRELYHFSSRSKRPVRKLLDTSPFTLRKINTSWEATQRVKTY